MQDGLARLLAERLLKVLAVVHREIVPRHRLSAILVYSLENLDGAARPNSTSVKLHTPLPCLGKVTRVLRAPHLVSGRITQAREQRHKLLPQWCGGLVLEYDGVQLREVGDLDGQTVSAIRCMPATQGG